MRWHETAGAVTPLPAAPAVEAVIAEAVARRRAAAFAAGTAMNSELDIEGNAGMTIADTLASVPGVMNQTRPLNSNRLSASFAGWRLVHVSNVFST